MQATERRTMVAHGRPAMCELRFAAACQVVVHRKSNIALAPQTLEDYRAQTRAHMDATQAGRGVMVLGTSGMITSVPASEPRCRGSMKAGRDVHVVSCRVDDVERRTRNGS
jgi:hypothetical protein